MKVLIIDDSATMRRLLRNYLGDLVDEFDECDDGRDALAAYKRSRPDFVLMDVDIQGMNGLAAARRLSAAAPEARVVLLSQWTTPALLQSARCSGAEACIDKGDLRLLRRLLGGAGH
jgi:CheY-like chemotaxis protein